MNDLACIKLTPCRVQLKKMGHTCLLTLCHFHLFDHSFSDESRGILPSAARTTPRATLSLCGSAILDTFDSISRKLRSCWWPMGPTHCLKKVVTYCCSQTGFPHFSMRDILVCNVMYLLLSIYQTTSHDQEYMPRTWPTEAVGIFVFIHFLARPSISCSNSWYCYLKISVRTAL